MRSVSRNWTTKSQKVERNQNGPECDSCTWQEGTVQSTVAKMGAPKTSRRTDTMARTQSLEHTQTQGYRHTQWLPNNFNRILSQWRNIYTSRYRLRVRAYSKARNKFQQNLFQYKDFPGIGVPIIKTRQSWDHLFIMGIPILVRWHLYIEMDHLNAIISKDYIKFILS